MFNGLDQIDWQGLGYHVYQGPEQIPGEIRSLLSEDADRREEAREFLLGGGQDFGDIYDTTPHILPFMFEILGDPDAPDRDKLLYHLSGVADKIAQPYDQSIQMLRLRLKTYEALQAGLDTLLRLLDDPSPEVRSADVELLGGMTDEVERLFPELLRHFSREGEEAVQVAILSSLKRLLSSMTWQRYSLKGQYADFFKETVETHPSRRVRVAAARASVELAGYHQGKLTGLSPQVPQVLAQEFLELSAPLDYQEEGMSSYHAGMVARDLTRLLPETLTDLLQDPTLSAEQAHLIARALLANLFLVEGQFEAHWGKSPDFFRKDEGWMYQQHHYEVRMLKIRPLYQAKRRYLQALVAAGQVWSRPTNLFSFFYGLPDTPQGWQDLLAELEQKFQEDQPG